MEWILGFIIILLIGSTVELFGQKGFRSKLSAIFGGIAILALLILVGCVVFLSYVGVWIVYTCIPTIIIGTLLWWLIKPKSDLDNRDE